MSARWSVMLLVEVPAGSAMELAGDARKTKVSKNDLKLQNIPIADLLVMKLNWLLGR